MVGPRRPQFVLFGSSIVQMSYNVGGWGAIFADLYARKVQIFSVLFCVISQVFCLRISSLCFGVMDFCR